MACSNLSGHQWELVVQQAWSASICTSTAGQISSRGTQGNAACQAMGTSAWQHMQAEHCQQTKRFMACQAPCSTYRATMSNGKSSATPQCTAHKGRLLGLGLPVSSSADVLASLCFWARSCSTSCIRSICRPG